MCIAILPLFFYIKNKKTKIVLMILMVVMILVILYFTPIPCGGMTEDGVFWDANCRYGDLLIKNLRHGNFFWPVFN